MRYWVIKASCHVVEALEANLNRVTFNADIVVNKHENALCVYICS